jgi:hypothetical protein
LRQRARGPNIRDARRMVGVYVFGMNGCFISNIRRSGKLHNRTRLTYISSRGYHVLIPRIKLAPSDANLPFTLQRTQFSVRLAHSITISKAQGQTFERVGLYLQAPVFSHGQLYVAFSRARSFSDIYVSIEPTSSQGFIGDPPAAMTQNVVFREIL